MILPYSSRKTCSRVERNARHFEPQDTRTQIKKIRD
jgi:hypothetical protein